MRSMRIGMLVIAAALASPVARADKAHDIATERLAALKTAARCDDAKSPQRVWCTVAAFDTGTAAALPTGKVLVGLTIELETGKDVAAALRDKVSLAGWSVASDGKVKLTSITPDNAQEGQMIGEAVGATAAVFKGLAKTAKLPADLTSYVKTLPAKYPATKSGGEWVWTGASAGRARKVGAYWVVIEVPDAQNGVFATILTDAWE